MTQSETVLILEKVQAEFDISRFKYKGKNVWPIIRYYFALVLLKPKYKENDNLPETSNEINDDKQVGKVKRYSLKAKALLDIFKLPLLKLNYNKAKKSLINLNAEVAFISPSFEPYPDKINDKKYSRYLDPYYEVFSRQIKPVKIQFSAGDQEYSDNYIPVCVINEQKILNKIRIEGKLKSLFIKTNEKKKLLAELNEIGEYVKQNNIDFIFQNWLADHVEEANEYEIFFLDILKKSKVKIVFFEAYYSPCMFGLISACKQLNIKTVDIQHGVVDINYLAWRNLKKEESVYLPHYYWTWSKDDFNQVLKQNDREFITPIEGGNMWLKKFRDNKFQSVAYEADLKKWKSYDKKILISLQYGAILDTILDTITDLIRLSGDRFFWHLRFHPLNNMADRSKVIARLNGLKNVEWDFATETQLYDIFNMVDFHIVASSAVALEGLQFNLPTIIIHELGGDLFKNLINEKVFALSTSPAEILNLLKEFKPSVQSVNYKIETSEELALKKLQLLLKDEYLLAS